MNPKLSFPGIVFMCALFSIYLVQGIMDNKGGEINRTAALGMKHQNLLTNLTNNDVIQSSEFVDHETYLPIITKSRNHVLAFIYSRDIWAVEDDGTNLHQITNVGNGYIRGYSWSPDGTKIAFISNNDIYIINSSLDKPNSPDFGSG